jgi:hypothetical protein
MRECLRLAVIDGKIAATANSGDGSAAVVAAPRESAAFSQEFGGSAEQPLLPIRSHRFKSSTKSLRQPFVIRYHLCDDRP